LTDADAGSTATTTANDDAFTADHHQIGKFELILEHDNSDGYQYKLGEWLQSEIVLVVIGSRPLEANSISVELHSEA
jgi:hypothetical protein